MAIVNPSRIVFTGASARAFSLIEDGMRSGLEEALVEALRRNTAIETRPWDQDLVVAGLLADALGRLDREVFALPAAVRQAAATP
ncbi:hypothetical protein A6302_00763 [Methylobrevis pamukkalensis]|uniref:Uncharacterized protein n=1 Tax=Methylobrevis pamukkalensis TaxID=1439726 RepID=A0A1E3H8W0_9HYPH|nr:hypothetical protein A6302_00763 [Methylobrevis pamukkalensis]